MSTLLPWEWLPNSQRWVLRRRSCAAYQAIVRRAENRAGWIGVVIADNGYSNLVTDRCETVERAIETVEAILAGSVEQYRREES